MKDGKDYTYRSMYEERKGQICWYSGVWKILRPLLVGLCAVTIVCGLLLTGWNWIYDSYIGPVDAEDGNAYSFTVSSGQSLTRVSNNLEKAGLIHNKTVFKYYCDFAGMGQKIQTGSYLITKDMSMMEIADLLTTGDGNAIVRNITLIPGETIEEFGQKLVQLGALTDLEAFLELCRSGKAFQDFYYIDDVLSGGTASERKYVLEGYLAPDTYEVYTDASAEAILRKLLSQTEAVFPQEKQERAAELGYSMDQILTLASMIEKEAGTADFAKVSAVFHNRLKQGMKLQSDVTIHYITGVKKMALEQDDLKLESGYNTYLQTGLPVGPICNPSEAAIDAALYPDEDYVAQNMLYFCAKEPESGSLYFSRTLEEHEQAVAIYQPLWQKYDEERGIE